MSKLLRFLPAFFILGACLFFYLNKNHDLQQAIYRDYYVPLAESLVKGEGFVLNRPSPVPVFFPMWGYPAVLALPIAAGLPTNAFILTLQFLLCLAGIFTFYRTFSAEPRWWHIVLFLPWFALMSVKWPEAITGFLILLTLFFIRRLDERKTIANALFAAGAAGAALQFRTEMILWIITIIGFVGVLKVLKLNALLRFRTVSVFAAVALVTLVPWVIRGYVQTGKIFAGSSNGGAVFYIGLGQLPHNPWGIAYSDTSAIGFAVAHGESDPWSVRANDLFVKEDIRLVTEYPVYFFLKCGYVAGRAAVGGCFAGELPTFVESSERLNAVRAKLASGDFGFFLHDLSLNEQALWFVQIVLLVMYRIVLLVAVLLGVWFVWRRRLAEYRWIDLFVVGLLISEAVVVTFVQYESRHINLVFLPFCGWLLEHFGRNKQHTAS